jgi:hypothetical protein
MWFFLNPLFLWAGLAALIPLLLHLLQRRRIVHIPFSTLRFLRLAEKRSSRRIRMENFLLWLLRTLVVLALVAAFAVPVLRTERFGRFVGGSQRDVALVLDASYSMGYASAQRRVWEEAQGAAAAVLQGLHKGDRVCLILAEDTPRALIAQPTTDLALALSLVKAQQPGPWPSHLRPAVDLAVATLRQSARREREIHVITDGHAAAWRAADGSLAPPPAGSTADGAAAAFVTLVGPRDPFNAYPREVAVEPALLMAGQPVRVTARLGLSGAPEPLAVSLWVDDQEVVRRSVAPGPEGALEDLLLTVPALEAGAHHARLAVPADGLAVDDEFHFLLRVRERLKVLCVGTAPDTFYLSRALNPGGRDAAGFEVTAAAPDTFDGADLADYPCVILCNAMPLSGQAVLALEEHVRRGGTLVLYPGDRGTLRDYDSWTCLPAKPVDVRTVAEGERVRELRLLARKDPFFTGFKLPPGAVPTVALQRELVWGAPAEGAATLIAAGADSPFLWSRSVGAGRVFFYGVSADRRWSSFPLCPLFLPLNHQAVLFGAGLGRAPVFHWTARTLLLSDAVPELRESDRLSDPAGAAVALRRERQEARSLTYADEVAQPGVYDLVHAGADRPEPVLAVNVIRSESDLTPVPERDIPGLAGLPDVLVARDRDELQRLIEEHRRGRPLAEPLLWLALLLAVLEGFLANRLCRRAGALSEKLRVDAAGRIGGLRPAAG